MASLDVHVRMHPECLKMLLVNVASFQRLIIFHAAEKKDAELVVIAKEFDTQIHGMLGNIKMEIFKPKPEKLTIKWVWRDLIASIKFLITKRRKNHE